MKFLENCPNILVYWPVQLYLIIFKIDWFIVKTKRVSVQLGHSVCGFVNNIVVSQVSLAVVCSLSI